MVALRHVFKLILPDHFADSPAEQAPMWVLEVVTMMLGFFIASALFAGLKAVRQSYWILQRLKGRPPAYIIMVWVSWSCGVVQSGVNYAYLRGRIPPR